MGGERPWWLRLDGVPPGYHERRTRQPTRAERVTALTIVGLLFAVSLGVAAWNGYADRRLALRLQEDGVTVNARVVDFRNRGRLAAIVGDEVKVAFSTEEGDLVRTWVVVGLAVDEGPTEVRYLRSDPHVARLRDDMKPRATALPMLSVIGSVIGLGLWFLIRWTRRNRDFD